MNIYKVLDRIDDDKSLSEKYNVKSCKAAKHNFNKSLIESTKDDKLKMLVSKWDSTQDEFGELGDWGTLRMVAKNYDVKSIDSWYRTKGDNGMLRLVIKRKDTTTNKKDAKSSYIDKAIAWYIDSGTAEEEADEWCEENPEDWNISHPRFKERAMDWYESSYYRTLDDDEDEVNESLTESIKVELLIQL